MRRNRNTPNEYDKIEENYIGLMEHRCTSCDSYNFFGEAVDGEYTACCNKGLDIIPPLITISSKIKNLFTGIFIFVKQIP